MAGVVNRVVPGSPAERAGLRPGDQLVAIDGLVVHDVIDVRFYGDADNPVVLIRRGDEQLQLVVDKYEGEDLGLEFADGLFDGILPCCNRCVFCFIDQLPPGLRDSLYVKDDDFRLSFLHGSYVTLTGLTREQEQRIIDQGLSPLYVSVHAVSSDVRRQLMGTHREEGTLRAMARFAQRGIKFHCQIVVCPGINDGEELVRTLRYLLDLGQAVRSVAVVPVGLTCHRQGSVQLKRCTASDAMSIIDCVANFRGRWRDAVGRGVVQAADELYLAAGRDIPAAREYEGFSQLDNGVGLVRLFLREVQGQRLMTTVRPLVMVTGELFAPILQHVVRGSNVRVVAVANQLFGPDVTVAGLLSGQDIAAAVRSADLDQGTTIIIPDCVLRAEDRQCPDRGLLLDGYTTSELQKEIGMEIRVVPASGSGLVSSVRGEIDE